ncbi:MAG: hypothetical protein Q9220_005227 [cf. Caloplaca sp. 1 TL-2023]
MSGELAQPTQEVPAQSNAASKDLPNSLLQPAATEYPDSSTFAASPVASTFLNSASTTAQASPTKSASDNLDQSEYTLTDLASEKPKEPQAASPSTSAGLQPPAAQSKEAIAKENDLSGQEKSSKRESRGSIKLSSRRGSAGSNKVTKDRTVVPTVSSKEKSAVEEAPSSTTKPKKTGISRLLSVLNCCGSSKDANAFELDQTVPPKKAKTLQSNRGRQTTPMTKPNASAGESTKTESKEALEDNIAGPRYSELTAAAKPKIIEPPEKPTTNMEKVPAQSENNTAFAESKTIPVQPSMGDQPLPPLPPNTHREYHNSNTNIPESFNEKSNATATDGQADLSKSSVLIGSEGGVSKEEMEINDRTPQQEAKDVEMTDAPPITSVPEPQTARQETSIQSPPQPALPPPPPIMAPSRPSAAERRTSNGLAPTDQPKWLLPPIDGRFRGKKCLVLDLDETLVHSSFKILHQADFTIPVEIEGQYHNVYVIKRPGVDQFMKRVGELYEVVVFTASVAKYGDPLLDQLDIHHVVHHRLFRESCYNHQGNYVKDLSQVGRDLRETIIIDNSPTSYIFHPQHAVPISSWFSDAHDNELLDLIPVLEDLAGPQVRDVSLVLDVGL